MVAVSRQAGGGGLLSKLGDTKMVDTLARMSRGLFDYGRQSSDDSDNGGASSAQQGGRASGWGTLRTFCGKVLWWLEELVLSACMLLVVR